MEKAISKHSGASLKDQNKVITQQMRTIKALINLRPVIFKKEHYHSNSNGRENQRMLIYQMNN